MAAVTGATGFLGRHIVRALSDAGFRVRILARRDPIDPLWRDLTPEVVPGALRDARALARLTDGADVVIHNAGLVKASNRAAFDAVNVAGAIAVAEAAVHVPHVLLVSSLAAREPQLSHYAASKRAGEDAMRQRLGERLTVVRPVAIYGPGDREIAPVFELAAKIPFLPVLSATGRVGMIHAQDCARQIAALAGRPPSGATYGLSDGRPDGYTWGELMQAAALAASGREAKLLLLPAALIHAIGRFNDLVAALGSAPMLTSGKARELLHADWSVLPAEQAPQLPPPLHTLETGFSDAARPYRAAA